jgi:HPt (histidine-containing phosphotransfer) domain-containing protein
MQEIRYEYLSVKPFTERCCLSHLSVLDLPAESINISTGGITDPAPVHSRIDLNSMPPGGPDKTFVKQMLIRFIEGTELGLEQILQAAEAGDMKAVMETAHRLSAPCRHIGADGLYSLLKAIENEALNHGTRIMELFTDSRREFENIRQELNEHIEKMKP